MGKILERMVTVPLGGDGDALEAVYLAPSEGSELGAVVAPPHPLFGGSMDSPVVSEVAYACRKRGLAALRFNWRGVGASGGEISGDLDAADADYSAATEQLELTVSGALVAAGYSFGAAAAVRAALRHDRFERLILVSPPVRLLDPESLGMLAGDLLVLTGQQDEYAPPAALQAALRELPDAQVRVIPDADHFFVRGLADIGREIEEWL